MWTFFALFEIYWIDSLPALILANIKREIPRPPFISALVAISWNFFVKWNNKFVNHAEKICTVFNIFNRWLYWQLASVEASFKACYKLQTRFIFVVRTLY